MAGLTRRWDEEVLAGTTFPAQGASLKGSNSRLTDEVSENLTDPHHLTRSGGCSYASLAVQYEAEFGASLSPTTLYGYYRKLGVTVTESCLRPLLEPEHKVAGVNSVLGHLEHVGHGVCRLLPLKNRREVVLRGTAQGLRREDARGGS